MSFPSQQIMKASFPALNVSETVKNDSAKAWALKAIAINLTEKGQYNQALEITKTIFDGFSKQRALDAIARYNQRLP